MPIYLMTSNIFLSKAAMLNHHFCIAYQETSMKKYYAAASFMKYITALLALAALTGCALPKHHQMSQQEWRSTTSRSYDATEPQVLEAAQRIFMLADGDDFRFTHQDNGIYATRNWSFYLVFAAGFGVDYWRIDAADRGGQTDVRAFVFSQVSPYIPTPIAYPGGFSATAFPGPLESVPGNAIYRLFWARMDWMLGKLAVWPDCKVSNSRINSGKDTGYNEPLCNSLNVNDKTPTEKDRIIPYGQSQPQNPKSAREIIFSAIFDESQAKALLAHGESTLKGSAMMIQNDGGIATCAGGDVRIFPATDYAKERMKHIYKAEDAGFLPVGSNNMFADSNIEQQKAYLKHFRHTKCDDQGYFKFENLAGGKYFVLSTIVWPEGQTRHGGHLMRQIELNSGTVQEIALIR